MRFNEICKWRRAVMCGAVGVAVGSVTNPAHAYPTQAPFWGPSGLGSMPTTDTVPLDQVEFGVNYESVNPAVGKTRFAPVVTATYGAERGELGVAYARERDTAPGVSFHSDYFALHGKLRLLGSENKAQLAVGAHYLNFGSAPGSLTSYYLAASAPLLKHNNQARLRGHLGVIHHRVKSFAPNNETRPMFGLEWRQSSRLTVAADYLPKKGNSASISSIIARYQWPCGLSAQVGVGQFRGDDNRLFAGVSYLFDTTKNKDTLFGKTPGTATVAVAAGDAKGATQ